MDYEALTIKTSTPEKATTPLCVPKIRNESEAIIGMVKIVIIADRAVRVTDRAVSPSTK